MRENKLIEDMADQAHKSWSGWMKHLFSKGTMNPDGSFSITPKSVVRWITQMNLPYEMLSEQEKDSDRIEAEKYLEILKKEGWLKDGR